jgi:hypothetical protein
LNEHIHGLHVERGPAEPEERRSGSTRTVEGYSRMLCDFFGKRGTRKASARAPASAPVQRRSRLGTRVSVSTHPPRQHSVTSATPSAAPGKGGSSTGASRIRQMSRRLDPVALILLLAAFFDWISGNPVHGLFLGSVGVVLARTTYAARRASREPGSAADCEPIGGAFAQDTADEPGVASGAPALRLRGRDIAVGPDHAALLEQPLSPRSRGASRTLGSRYASGLFLSAAVTYALVVAGFPRYSWPATIGVAALAVAVIIRGWNEPGPQEPVSTVTCPRRGFIAWAVIVVVGALWELGALLLQPDLSTGSEAHPTVSVLADAVLASYLGRAFLLLAWVACGWYLIRQARR